MERYKYCIKQLETQMNEDYNVKLRQQVEVAISMLDIINSKVKEQKITLEGAKIEGDEFLRSLKCGRDNYFWSDTVDDVNVVFLGSKTEGTNRLNAQNNNGSYFIKGIIKNGQNEKVGHTDY